MKLSIVIVNWNVGDLLCACLDSIYQNVQSLDFEIIVVDNSSTDSSVAMVKKQYPEVKLILNRFNEGFARANNQAFRMSTGKFILILNPDTLIKDNAIQEMISAFEKDEKIGMVGPLIFDGDGMITLDCRRDCPTILNSLAKLFLLEKLFLILIKKMSFLKESFLVKYYSPSFVKCIQGACMMVSRDALFEAGLFDETIPMYLDDKDLCFRFSLRGFKILYWPNARIIHLCGASTLKSKQAKLFDVMVFGSTDFFFSKHYGPFHSILYRLMLAVAGLIFFATDLLISIVPGKRRLASILMEKHIKVFVYGITGSLKLNNFKSYKSNDCQ